MVWSSQGKLKILTIVALVAAGGFWLLPPFSFPVYRSIKIEPGTDLATLSQELVQQKVVRSAGVFRLFVHLFSGDARIIAGHYFLDRRLPAPALAWRITSGYFGREPVRVTFPEGLTVSEMAQVLKAKLSDFDADEFIHLARPLEGYLFPDTYFFPPEAAPQEVLYALQANFSGRLAGLSNRLKAAGLPLNEIMVMASLLEEEARQFDTKRLIAGILWKRLANDMPLQVDAVFPYILGKNSFELTLDDLAFDSEYNTYKYKGLPPAPITNPGLDSIIAALEPVDSPYWFYLSDLSGRMHYAVNFDEHKINKARYLR